MHLPTLIVGDKKIECRLVVFDLDGTLLDDEPRYRFLAEARMKAMTRVAGREAAEAWARLSGIDPSTLKVDMNGPLSKAPRREDVAIAAAAVYLSGRRWHDAKSLAEEAYDEADRMQSAGFNPSFYPRTRQRLEEMKGKGLKLGVATNGQRAITEEALKRLDASGLFDVVLGADDVKNAKPAPDMILCACERLGFKPEEAVYVGDQPTDVAAGRAAGCCATIAVGLEVASLSDFAACSVADIIVG
jgi:HAD superfamily hydrolase (TIGR01509 family)